MHAIAKIFVSDKSIYRGRAPDFFFNGKFETVGGDKTNFLLDLFFLSHNGGEKGRYGRKQSSESTVFERKCRVK